MTAKDFAKKIVDATPGLPGLIWRMRHPDQVFPGSYNLTRLRRALPEACAQVRPFVANVALGKKVFIFGTLHYWVEEGTLISLALAGMGHQVTFAYLPYAKYHLPVSAADLRRQDRYTRDVLKPARGLIDIVSLLQVGSGRKESLPQSTQRTQRFFSLTEKLLRALRGENGGPDPSTNSGQRLPPALEKAVQKISAYDVEYTLETEEADTQSDLYVMRLQRNRLAACAALTWFQSLRPDVAIIPNGLVIELGAVYQAAIHLGIPVVTYEFNEDREQLWLSQGDEIMKLNTKSLWQARGPLALTDGQRKKVEAMQSARSGAEVFGNSERRWQEIPTQGSEQARKSLGLDSRPVVLLATNVLGDSLILGRNIFSQTMAEWITRTVQYFAERKDVQLIVRIHPGEKYTRGATMTEVVHKALPELPENIHLIEALDKVNTYDLMKLTDLGLVFVTTAGLEMVMRGIPVIVVGETHYRGCGFTLDPQTWDEYFAMLESVIAAPERARPTAAQVEAAWNYTYRFFFEYPRPFPWRLVEFWQDFEKWPLARVLSEEGRKQFGKTFGYLTGEPLDWKYI